MLPQIENGDSSIRSHSVTLIWSFGDSEMVSFSMLSFFDGSDLLVRDFRNNGVSVLESRCRLAYELLRVATRKQHDCHCANGHDDCNNRLVPCPLCESEETLDSLVHVKVIEVEHHTFLRHGWCIRVFGPDDPSSSRRELLLSCRSFDSALLE